MRNLPYESSDLKQWGATALQAALYHNEYDRAINLLQSGENPNQFNYYFPRPYFISINNNHSVSILDRLFACGADIDAINNEGETALICSIKRGSQELMEWLLSKGANSDFVPFNTKIANLYPALHLAVLKNNSDMVIKLLKSGANPNLKEANYGDTPLIIAVRSRSFSICKLLLEAGVEPNLCNFDGKDAAFYAFRQSDKRLYNLINSFGTDRPVSEDLSDELNLIEAIENEQLSIVESLLATGVNPECKNNTGQTILDMALAKRNFSLIKILIDFGAHPFRRRNDGLPCFFANLLQIEPDEAAKVKNPNLSDILKYIHRIFPENTAKAELRYIYHSQGSSIHIHPTHLKFRDLINHLYDKNGFNPFLNSILNIQPDTFSYFLAHGINIEQHDLIWGFTPLQLACLKGNIFMVNELIRHGVEVNTKNYYNDSALYLLSKSKIPDYAEDFPNFPCNGFRDEFCHKIIDILIKAGANPYEINGSDGISPLSWAFENKNKTLIDIFSTSIHFLQPHNKPSINRNSLNVSPKPLLILVNLKNSELVSSPNHKIMETGKKDKVRILNKNEESICSLLKSGKFQKAHQLAMQQPILVVERDNEGNSPLILACKNNCNKLAKSLLEMGANLYDKNHEGLQAMFFALNNHNTNIIRLMLKMGFEMLQPCQHGKTYLQYAIELYDPRITRLIFSILANQTMNNTGRC